MSARRKRKKRISKTHDKSWHVYLRYLFWLLLTISVVVFIFINTNYWRDNLKVSVIFPGDEYVKIVILDSEIDKITSINIPSSTQTEVARNLGLWKIGSVWQLGKDEKIGGSLLKETVTNHLKMPVVAWGSEKMQPITNANVAEKIGSMLVPGDTSLSFTERLRIAFFSIGVNKNNREEIYLEDTTYLEEKMLPDGDMGFVLTGRYPDRLYTLFTDSKLAKDPYVVNIQNSSGDVYLAEEMAKTIEVIGAKVVSIKQNQSKDTGCAVVSSSEEKAKVIAKYFNCDIKVKDISLDAEIRIGEEYINRF